MFIEVTEITGADVTGERQKRKTLVGVDYIVAFTETSENRGLVIISGGATVETEEDYSTLQDLIRNAVSTHKGE